MHHRAFDHHIPRPNRLDESSQGRSDEAIQQDSKMYAQYKVTHMIISMTATVSG